MKYLFSCYSESGKKAFRREWSAFLVLICAAIVLLLNTQGCSMTQAKAMHENSTQKDVDLVWAVASDLHVMDTSIVKHSGKAFQAYLKHDRKLLSYSRAMLDSLYIKLAHDKPSFLLISGDLTKDGAYVSHRYLINNLLKPLHKAGIQPIVVPGNHDLMNPHAYIYDGDKSIRTRTVGPKQFKKMYGPYGYNQAISNDSASLSYVVELGPKVRLLCLDANQYRKNDFNLDTCPHNGVLADKTLEFIEREANEAKELGVRMMIMLHHGVIAHWRLQNQASPGYVLDNAQKLRKLCYKYNIEICMTGHSHSQDIALHSYWGSDLYDIQTGSLVTYPCPYRLMHLHGDSLDITSRRVSMGEKFDTFAKESLTEGVATYSLPYVPESFPDTLRKRIAADVGKLMVIHACGDEEVDTELHAELSSLDVQMRRYAFFNRLQMAVIIKALSHDSGVKDNDVVLLLSPVLPSEK